MSIWGSAGRRDDSVRGLWNASDCTNYHGYGESDYWLDVATATAWHDKIRLKVAPDDGQSPRYAEVLLDAVNARQLARWLTEAADEAEHDGDRTEHGASCELQGEQQC